MHVGLVGPRGVDLFLDNIAEALVQMGHRVSFLGNLDVRKGGRVIRRLTTLAVDGLPQLEHRIHSHIERRARERECDLVLNTHAALGPEVVASIRRAGIPIALWFPDAVSNLGRARMLAAEYNAFFFKDPLLTKRLRDTLGLPVWYLPEACNPNWHRPIGDAGSARSIAVVGNIYPSRLQLLKRLYDAGIPLTLHGGQPAKWLRQLLPDDIKLHPPVYREEKSRLFRTAAGVLNNLHPAEMHSVNCRLFEATAAGAAVLCEARPTLAELYDSTREIAQFETFDELVASARALLDDPALTKSLGDAASLRAHSEHTYEHRLMNVLERTT